MMAELAALGFRSMAWSTPYLEQPHGAPTDDAQRLYQVGRRQSLVRRGRPRRRLRLARHAHQGRRRHPGLHQPGRERLLARPGVARHRDRAARLQVRLRRGAHPEPCSGRATRSSSRTARRRERRASTPSRSTRPTTRPSTRRSRATACSSSAPRPTAARRRPTSSGPAISIRRSSTGATARPSGSLAVGGLPAAVVDLADAGRQRLPGVRLGHGGLPQHADARVGAALDGAHRADGRHAGLRGRKRSPAVGHQRRGGRGVPGHDEPAPAARAVQRDAHDAGRSSRARPPSARCPSRTPPTPAASPTPTTSTCSGPTCSSRPSSRPA